MDHIPESSIPPRDAGRLERFVSIDSKPFEHEANEVAAFYELLANQDRCRQAIRTFGGAPALRIQFEKEHKLPPGAFELMVFINDPEVRGIIRLANMELAASNREGDDINKFRVRLESLSEVLAVRYPGAQALLTRLTGSSMQNGVSAWRLLNKNRNLPLKYYALVDSSVSAPVVAAGPANAVVAAPIQAYVVAVTSVRLPGPPLLASL